MKSALFVQSMPCTYLAHFKRTFYVDKKHAINQEITLNLIKGFETNKDHKIDSYYFKAKT